MRPPVSFIPSNDALHSNQVSTEHIAGVIAFLVSDDAFHINGIEIAVDGGKIGLA